jgi:hypothetical protein
MFRSHAAWLAMVPLLACAAEPEAWNAHVQATYISQSKEAMTSPYAGPHSLSGAAEGSYSLTATAAFGWRPLDHTELYFDAEGAQGDPLSGLQGLAQFTNGEMARSSGPTPVFYRARLFVRQTVPLGDETEAVESAANQLAGPLAKHRLVLSAGFVPVQDIFDGNAYAHDPRTQFMNLAFMTYTAWDYPADARGYTWGAAAELVDEAWALRIGRFAQPKEPNGKALDSDIAEHYGDSVELEHRVDLLPGQAGTVHLLAFRNRALMARYDDALALAEATESVPDLPPVRTRDQVKFGFGAALEQPLADDLGVFGRAMWADGQTETYAFAESDRSLSAGAVMQGMRWGRGKDAVGLAFGQSFIAQAHRTYLERGGLTFFLGDGRLDYRPEQVLEAYYLLTPFDHAGLAFDMQRIGHPGYNADRGPATLFAIRLHVEV